MTSVPIIPEPLEALRTRYPRALEAVYDAVQIRDHGGIRPGEVAAQVFDHEDGLRLIISRERLPNGRLTLHVSASFPRSCRLASDLKAIAHLGPGAVVATFINHVRLAFKRLSGDERPLHYLWLSDGFIPHFLIEEGSP